MKNLLCYLYVFMCLSAAGQNKNPILKFSPLALVDEISFPTIQGGIEFRLLKKIGFYNEAGVKYRKSYYDNADTNYYTSKGFKLKTELRYYFTIHGSSDKFYIATNAFYAKDYRNTALGYFYRKDSTDFRLDNFGVRKLVWGFNLLVGGHHYLSKRLLFDYYTGFGIRYRDVLTTNKEFNFDRDEMRGPNDLNVNSMRNKTDAGGEKSTVVNFTLGIRIGYQF